MLDAAVKAAIVDAVGEAEKPPAVAARLIAWLERLTEGGEVGRDEKTQFLDNVRHALGEGSDAN